MGRHPVIPPTGDMPSFENVVGGIAMGEITAGESIAVTLGARHASPAAGSRVA